MSRPERTTILDARALSRALQRMAVEVLELAHGTDDLILIGIQRRGVELAERIAKLIEKQQGVLVPRGALDITLNRADLGRPKRISLCVLVDRGGRELPIQPDIVGEAVKVGPAERVDVFVAELDGRDEVTLVRKASA